MWRAVICRKAFTTSSSEVGCGDILGVSFGAKTKTGRAVYPHCTELRLRDESAASVPRPATLSPAYLDLISADDPVTRLQNPFESYGIRQFARGFMEVETPMMQVIRAARRVVYHYHNALDLDMYLRIAPGAVPQKASGGWHFRTRIEINVTSVAEGISVRHPEFTMMELYMAYADYKDLIELTESHQFPYAGRMFWRHHPRVPRGDEVFDFGKPLKLTMREAIKKYRPETDMADLDSFDLRRRC